MAEITLDHASLVDGNYGTEAVDFISNTATTILVSGLTATLSADKAYWINGPLTYTINIENTTAEDFSDATLTDNLDISKIYFVDNSVTIGATASTDFTYDESTGALVITLPTIAAGGTLVVTFQVKQNGQ